MKPSESEKDDPERGAFITINDKQYDARAMSPDTEAALIVVALFDLRSETRRELQRLIASEFFDTFAGVPYAKHTKKHEPVKGSPRRRT